MIYIHEKGKALSLAFYLKDINSILFEMGTILGRLAEKLAVMQYKENYIKEGTTADKVFVNIKIKELQILINQLDKTRSRFSPVATNSYKEIQEELSKSQLNINFIRENMLLVWSMRNKGETKKDNEIIQNLIKVMFTRVNALLKDILGQVALYNKNNKDKLKFNVKWTPLPR